MTYYDQIALSYNELHGEEQLAKAKIVLQNLKISPNNSLLDVGCGTGIATELFSCKKTGIDPSAELLKSAKFETIVGKAERLPFPDNSFDIVLSLTAIHHFSDVKKALSEMFRVSKRDVVVSVLKKAQKFKEVEELISAYKPYKRVEEEHDVIFFCKKLSISAGK